MRQDELRPALYHRLHRLVPLIAHPAVRWIGRFALRAWSCSISPSSLLILALRYLILPNIENYRPEIERQVSQAHRPFGRHRPGRRELGRDQP
jgi:hypothetical protein